MLGRGGFYGFVWTRRGRPELEAGLRFPGGRWGLQRPWRHGDDGDVHGGLPRGGHGMVVGCAWVRVFLVAGDKALAYALQVWGAMVDGEVRRQSETERGESSPWVAWKSGW